MSFQHFQLDGNFRIDKNIPEDVPGDVAPVVGLVEWFRPGEEARVKQVIEDMKKLGISYLRTGVSWADTYTSEGEKWYKWLIPYLASHIKLLPCFSYTPPSLGVMPKICAPPKDPKSYADFLDVYINRFGENFEWVELWNEPNNLREWDVTLDPNWQIFSEMIGSAAYWARHLGKKTVLGGMSPINPNWLSLMFERGLMQYIDAVGIHGFPWTFEYSWQGWASNVERIRKVLDDNSSSAELWITESGFSTWKYDERQQVHEFVKAIEAPVDRVYWYAAHDLAPNLPTVEGFRSDEREYHFGLKKHNGTPKLLFRMWENGGIDNIRNFDKIHVPKKISRNGKGPVLITGGAGFIGTNLANRLLESGRDVVIYDNLLRPGVERNLQWLSGKYGSHLHVEIGDIRDQYKLRDVVACADQVFHLAAQVAVTTSLDEPFDDFQTNAFGTLNLLEAIRASKTRPPVVFTSTNKVYGGLDDIELQKNCTRYEPSDPVIYASGVSESRPLDFHSPYGCSKGTADQYMKDYARIYGLQTVVFRMSCIYGPHQFGTEDQGWVAHFLIRAIENSPITIYGDGKQVRDVLFVEDLVDAFILAQKNMNKLAGKVFNIGGGPSNTLSLIELMDIIKTLNGAKPNITSSKWRPGDQRYYVSNTSKFSEATGWNQKVSTREGVERLYKWLLESRGIPVSAVKAKGEELNADKSVSARI